MERQQMLIFSAAGTALLFFCLVAMFPNSRELSSKGTVPAASAATTSPQTAEESPPPPVPVTASGAYIEVVDGCGPHFEGGCLNVRSKPMASSTSVLQLRKGVVLPIAAQTITDDTGRIWYKVAFTEWIRYPERVKGDWYVAADFVKAFNAESGSIPEGTVATTTKRILVDRSDQKLYAYDGDTLFMESAISTGLDLTPTPRGVFTIYRKTPSRYMQGPLPGISDQYYDLPGVPWNMYFTKEGGAIHGAYWHNNFGQQWSHGCVNLPLDKAKELYEWAPLGTKVTVRD